MDLPLKKSRVETSWMVKQIWRGRGRPLSSMHSYKEGRILENLARIAMLHKVDSVLS
jgi:hypothetical protein